MVAPDPGPLTVAHTLPRFIYITGCDGTGKTTQARLLIDQLQAMGIKTHHVWLRFPFFFSLPLLAYARLRGYSWYEETDGVRHGYWDFRCSWLMKNAFPWVLLLDASLAALWKVYLPLWSGQTLVCERFVLDMLVDLAAALGNDAFYRHLPGRLYFRLLPSQSQIFILDLDAAAIRSRRADLVNDLKLVARLEAFRCLSAAKGYTQLSSQAPVIELNRQIWKVLKPSYAN